MSPPLQITEDTPPDMLAGSMDLCVMLPNGHTVKMSVERSTPMMDLLVQVTTANKISPAGLTIKALGERGVMPYKPSTPIGALDTWTIHIVPKSQVNSTNHRKAPLKPVNQPFEQTFRLQVHLPRNQLYVSRISPKTKLSDILSQVCNEKNLDPTKYSLRHPVKLDQVLNLSYCLADYKLTEVALVSNRTWPLGVSSVDIMSLQQNDNYRNHRSCEGSMSSGSVGGRSLSPSRSDGSSASPPPVVPPNRPIRKRRPAPKPPVAVNNNNIINNINNSTNNIDCHSNKCELQQSSSQGPQNTVICHSRNSSDSSGYHEASVLSESPESNSLPDSLPRRSKLPSAGVNESNSSSVGCNLSRSLSNLNSVGNRGVKSMKTHSISSTSLVSMSGRKKKAAPPPPPLLSKMSSVSEETPKQRTPSVSSNTSSSATLEDNDHNLSRKSSTLPASIRVAQPCSKPDNADSDISQSSSVISEPPCSVLDRLNDNTEGVPKPKPRTIFRTDSFASDISTKSIGDTSESIKNMSVNNVKPRKSRKSYPAPAPKPQNNVSNDIDNSSKCDDSSQNQIPITVQSETFEDEKQNVNKEVITREIKTLDRAKSADDAFVVQRNDYDDQSFTSSTSSVFIKTESDKHDTINKLKDFPSDNSLINKNVTDEHLKDKGRNFSVGHLEDVPSFLAKSPQLGRWKNMERLNEASPNACGVDNQSESEMEIENEKKSDPASELRLDDDEIDRIFHNATRDHTSLESGVGEEPPISMLSLPSPPTSITNQPESVVNNNADSLDWEYKLPAPPTFRDETNSPTVTEFDTVTIGNLTEVFGPESMLQTESKKQELSNKPDILSSPCTNNMSIADNPCDISNQNTENKLVNITTEIESKEVKNEKIEELITDQLPKESLMTIQNSSKPDLLKHSAIEEDFNKPEIKRTAVINELSSVINERTNKHETLNEFENSVKLRNSPDARHSSVLDNFVLTTYKDVKPVEVFEDDSVKSSMREKRDNSRDEAMFRAPKSIPRRFEPNITRRNSFNSDEKPVNITIKRSASHVSLLAGNISRGPYRSYLARSNGALAESVQLSEETEIYNPKLRKTTSEVNVSQGSENTKIADWRTSDSVGLQSLQVLRSILPQLSHTQSCDDPMVIPENELMSERVAPVSNKKFVRTLSEQKEEPELKESTLPKRYSYCGPPSINLSTWNERPKRQVSIKLDRDYCSGFGKLKSHSLDETDAKDSRKSDEQSNTFSIKSTPSNLNNDEKPDIVKNSSDLSRVPIVRAVEFKKPYSSSTIDSRNLNRSYFNSKSYENLSYIQSDLKNPQLNQIQEPVFNSSSVSTNSSISVISETPQSSSAVSNVDEERISSVNSLAKRFGQQRQRPSSCYLFNTSERNGEHVKPGNTSRVFLNASDKKFTSIVGINGLDNTSYSNSKNNVGNVTEIKIIQKPQTSKVIIAGKNTDTEFSNKSVNFKVNGNSFNNNESLSNIKAQSKISCGGYLENEVKKFDYEINRSVKPSLKENNNFSVKSFCKLENKSECKGGIPPPPPVMPVLKPVGERKQIKLLPPPQADPRDQLLESIRNFGGANSLKKIASK